ncbi:double-strand break repair helicase AddA [Falsihalocynthiibacter sp. BN13B15]|uniref:double-strand break repair helicase AddA n=1 Tax=Falsihalocynthiibacter sp. BN13B15 TaxID=3240871 RepID=UPI003510108B
MMRRDQASERQVQAASPKDSTWLSANAGSGKTRVLTDRVARLLLDKVLPQHILCLTYTKAAASEMQNRLFARLGSWAMLETDELKADLKKLGFEGQVGDAELKEARRLFARAIEAPGGLKIQTIHSFCASLLRRFPLEAGVSPQFVEMDDRAGNLLREEVVDEMVLAGDQWTVDGVAALLTDQDLTKFTAEISKYAANFPTSPDADDIWARFELTEGFSLLDLEERTFLPDDGALLESLMPYLEAGSSNDHRTHAHLRGLNFSTLSISDLAILEGTFLTGQKTKEPFTAKIGAVPTKPVQKQFSDSMDRLNNFMMRIEDARDTKNRLYAARKTLALQEFSAAFLPRYQAKKLWRGWLDFDDLILKARDLLTDPLVAQWVLYRLDGGIDHILVDEAQDTSPAQWSVIENLAQEFTSGAGARSDQTRTIFVVGDKKQSIYSFQGADPSEFDRMQKHFAARLTQIGVGLQSLQLEHSFRSSSSVLSVVDHSFSARQGHGVGGEMTHIAFKDAMPGRVDHWPIIESVSDEDDRHWADPVDRLSQNHHNVQLARMIAGEIRRMIDENVTIPQEIGISGTYAQRPVTEGDFLILVQGRSGIFPEIIQACKAEKLAIAGADRFRIGASLAVKDITALLSFLATSEDDLSLAAILRSPLFGWSEQDLYDLAQKRTQKYLWRALQERKKEFPETVSILEDLRDSADFLRPYELIERCLTDHKGRINLVARLGAEAEDGIDALLSQALSFEQMEIPSLTGFLTWLQSEEVEIKRQMDSASDQIRVMTVHGAKGLEAPIVILPDTHARANVVKSELIPLEDGLVTWKMRATEMPPNMADAIDTKKELQAQEKMRLLYVAMTRAEKWLITCGAGKLNKDGLAWHQLIEEGMKQAGAVTHTFPSGLGLRYQSLSWDDLPQLPSKQASEMHSPIKPNWAITPAPAPIKNVKPLSPSDLGGAKALAGPSGLSEDEAKERGTLIHLLLEYLPEVSEDEWPARAEILVGEMFTELLPEAVQCLKHTDLAFLFSGNALSEVNIFATLPELAKGNYTTAEISGSVDRLVIDETEIHVIDFKSNAVVPASADDVPEGLMRQMGAYCSALSQIYPNHTLRPAILWTKTATLMPLSHASVTDALARVNMP